MFPVADNSISKVINYLDQIVRDLTDEFIDVDRSFLCVFAVKMA